MATWSDLRGYIANKYKIMEDIGRGLALGFELEDGRTQTVFVTNYNLLSGREEWALIESPVGKLGQVDLGRAVQLIGDKVVGGIALATDFADPLVTVRHAVPLANLDVNEFEAPFGIVMRTADELEKSLTGSDTF